jgi:hypothetical protein
VLLDKVRRSRRQVDVEESKRIASCKKRRRDDDLAGCIMIQSDYEQYAMVQSDVEAGNEFGTFATDRGLGLVIDAPKNLLWEKRLRRERRADSCRQLWNRTQQPDRMNRERA